MTVAGLVLAAGSGSRFGGPKALVRLDGELLVHRAARVLREGGCEPVLVVVGAQADRVRREAGLPDAVLAPDWATGMGASLRAGLAALTAQPAGADAVVVALADQPLVGSAAVERLRAAHGEGAEAAVATYGGQPRNPVLLARTVWPDVARLAQGDEGARPFLRAHPERVTAVPCDGTGSPLDVDTQDDLHRLTHPDDAVPDTGPHPARSVPTA